MPDRASDGPWCRLRGNVVALDAEGRRHLVRAPVEAKWERALGYSAGARWQLPAGTVWACQPSRAIVQLADPGRRTDPRGPDVAEVAGECADVAVGDAQGAVVVEADAADAVAAGFDQAAVAAGVAADVAVLVALDQPVWHRTVAGRSRLSQERDELRAQIDRS